MIYGRNTENVWPAAVLWADHLRQVHLLSPETKPNMEKQRSADEKYIYSMQRYLLLDLLDL